MGAVQVIWVYRLPCIMVGEEGGGAGNGEEGGRGRETTIPGLNSRLSSASRPEGHRPSPLPLPRQLKTNGLR